MTAAASALLMLRACKNKHTQTGHGRLRSELTQHPLTVTPTNLPDLPP